MLRYLKPYNLIVALACLAFVIGSCSGGDLPLLPGSGVSSRAGASHPLHECWGLYDIFVSADRTQWDVVPRRAGMAHLNLVPLLEDPDPSFLTIPEDGLVFEEDYIAATVQIEHPLKTNPDFEASFFRGFDVKGIIMFPGTKAYPFLGITTQDQNAGEGRVLNADGYSRWWNPIEFAEGAFLESYVEGKMGLFPGMSDQINATVHPYKWIYSGQNRHSFPVDTTAKTTYHIVLPEPGKPFALMYAIDAAYEIPLLKPFGQAGEYKLYDFTMTANQPEPYFVELFQPSVVNTMWGDGVYEGGGTASFEISVYDWQDARYFKDSYNEESGLRPPYVEAPDFMDGAIKLEQVDLGINTNSHGYGEFEVSTGLIPEGAILIDGKEVPYTQTIAGNTANKNAKAIRDDINKAFTDSEFHNALIRVRVVDATGVLSGTGTHLMIESLYSGNHPVEIIDTPNLAHLGMSSILDATYKTPTPPAQNYWLIDNGIAFTKWRIPATNPIKNDKIIMPGLYPIIIAARDNELNPLFKMPGFDTDPGCITSYWIFWLEVSDSIPYICDEHVAVHNSFLGTGVITNALLEYRADCDFIGYPLSPYNGRLLFNKGTALPDGEQEICVMDVDTPGVASALTIITNDTPKKGIPLILQEDEVTGNIIVVNHTDQDDIFVYDYTGHLMNTFDHGDGTNAFDSPIAVDFDETGDMWIIGHRGQAGPHLRHWHNQGSGNYTIVNDDTVDLAPVFGTNRTILDMKLSHQSQQIIIFSNQSNGRIEYYDYSVSPPARIESLAIYGLYAEPVVPVSYPGLRIAGGGGLMIDRVDADLERCRVVAVANLASGGLGFQKFDFYANLLNFAYVPAPGELCFAMNNDFYAGKRHIYAFPIAEANSYNAYQAPAGW